MATWLGKYMLRHHDMNIPETEREAKAIQIAEWFGSEDSYDRFRTHARPIRYPELQSIGLRVRRLEDDDALQDAVLSILHVNEITFVSCDWSETRISEIVSILREETFK